MVCAPQTIRANRWWYYASATAARVSSYSLVPIIVNCSHCLWSLLLLYNRARAFDDAVWAARFFFSRGNVPHNKVTVGLLRTTYFLLLSFFLSLFFARNLPGESPARYKKHSICVHEPFQRTDKFGAVLVCAQIPKRPKRFAHISTTHLGTVNLKILQIVCAQMYLKINKYKAHNVYYDNFKLL